LCYQQADFAAIPLNDGVGANGVGKPNDVGVKQEVFHGKTQAVRSGLDAFQEANGQVVGGGGNFYGHGLVLVIKKSVGKSAARVDINRATH
jgi:hypothetical protein